ncbi:MAG TPA: DinB family protein [Bryobacteraceae bacterium]|nr:DinB family protein [Bryobacteraceae bacterium]
MVRVDHVLDSWKTIRRDTIAAVEEFPAGEFDFRPSAEMMTFGEIARHILAAGHGLTGMMLAGEDNMAAPDFREKARQHGPVLPDNAPREALLAAMAQSVEQRTAELAARPAEFFSGMMTRFDGLRLTRLEMIQTIKEHELTHRAQLFLYMRLKGMVPVTTRRRLAKQAGK